MSENLSLSHVIPTTPQRIFEAWLSSDEHSKMTGAVASIQGDQFTAWDGYIAGKTLETRPFERIVQTWRTNEFPDGAGDSDLVISFKPADGGTEVTLEQTNIPDGQREGYEAGWRDFYFTPMTEYFGTPGAKFKEASDAIESAVETAVEQASAQVAKVVNNAKKGAQKQAAKAVKSVKKAAKSLGTKVRAALKPTAKVAKSTAAPKKKVAAKAAKAAKTLKKAAKAVKKSLAPKKKAAPMKKGPAKKVAPKKTASKKVAAKKKSR